MPRRVHRGEIDEGGETRAERHPDAEALSGARARYPRSALADDDLLDAFAAPWSAHRIAAGEHARLPAGRETPTDAAGLPQHICVGAAHRP